MKFDDDAADLIEELCQAYVSVGIQKIKQETNLGDGERTRFLIEVAVEFLSKLLDVYPSIQPLDNSRDLIDEIIEELDAKKEIIPFGTFYGVVN